MQMHWLRCLGRVLRTKHSVPSSQGEGIECALHFASSVHSKCVECALLGVFRSRNATPHQVTLAIWHGSWQ